ncbi:MAG: pilus assembly protein PilM [Patescibacteria group bacterium]
MFLKRFFEFFPTPRFLKFSSVGIDIGVDTLHYAELIGDGKDAKLGRFGKEGFAPNPLILSNDSLKERLGHLKKEKKINFVKASLPEEETYLYTMEVTGDTDTEIRNEIEFHLEENVPLSGPDSLFDYYFAPREAGKKIIVVSVVPKETVDRYTTLFMDSGITPVSFLVESGALSRSLIKKGTSDTDLLLHLSHEKSLLAVSVRGFVEFSSTSSFGGAIFNSAIMKDQGVSEEEARKIKYERGILKTGSSSELSDSLANAMSVLRDEVQKVIIYWQKRPAAPTIGRIILCGKDAGMPGFADYLSVSLKMPVVVGDVWTNVEYYKDVVPPIPFISSHSFATPLGLVISG